MAGTAHPRYRARVVPRQGRGRASRIRWDRFGRVALVLVLFAVLVSYIGPTLNVFESWREGRSAESRLVTLKLENERLAREAKALEEPAAARVEARERGLVGPGEQPYVVEGLRSSP